MPVLWEGWVGQTVDEFPLLQHLGSSADSAVYLTNRRINGAGHKAAIKIVEARSTDADFRFSRWQSAVQLSHPHLIRMFGAGRFELNGTPLFYAVMEYAEENLAQLLPTRPLTPAEARDMLEPVLEALAYLHRQGFVHGCLKPGNIMAINDQLKLAVDGLYRVGDQIPARPHASSYEAPELTKGSVSPPADLWSLGVTLVEALTQVVPSRRASERSEPILPQELPEVFHDIAQHCLNADPTQRWTVPEVTTRLNPAPPVRTTLGPLQEKAQPQRAATRRWFVIAAVVLAAAILIGWLVMRRNSGATSENGKPQPAQVESAPKQPSLPPQAAPQKPSPAIESNAPARSGGNRENDSSRANPEVSQPTNAANDERIIRQVLPTVPRSARETITGTIKVGVKVNVDPQGNVSDAELINSGPSKYFARLAMEAAKKWQFEPTQNAQDWLLRFEFRRSGTTVHPVPAKG